MMKKIVAGGGAGFTIVELLISISILIIMASFIALNTDIARITATQEAAKIAAYIHKAMQRSDRIHDGFSIQLVGKDGELEIRIIWDSKGETKRKDMWIIPIDPSFRITSNVDSELKYSPQSNTFISNGRTFTVKRKPDNSLYYVIFYKDGGRIRISPKPPVSWEN